METTLEVAALGNHGSDDIFNEDMRVGALVMVKPLAPAKMASTTVEEYIILFDCDWMMQWWEWCNH